MTLPNFKIFVFLLLFIAFASINGCEAPAKEEPNETNYYSNPILAGFYPDPSICYADNAYYLINSSFSYFPGIPIFRSTDLVNWEQIGHVMDRPEQLSLEGHGISRGLFAPAIEYNNGLFYVICTLVDAGGNFVVTAENPAGPWSNPIWLPEVSGIDPSLFFDNDGKSYIVYNSEPPNNESFYNGHRTIKMVEFDAEEKKVLSEPEIIVNGGTDISKKPIWIEGPHIYFENDFYYLMAAEGGTAEGHSEVIFRSKNVDGPFEPYEKNPILTQRHFGERSNPVTSTGHADLIQDPSGDWWTVFLGCRPYADNHYNIGRETFMLPVTWTEDQWPVILQANDTVKFSYTSPMNIAKSKEFFDYSRNANFKDEFDASELALHYVFLRSGKGSWLDLQDRPGSLALDVRPETCSEMGNPSFVAHRQHNHNFEVTTSLDFSPNKNEAAGLVLFQNESHYYFLNKTIVDGQPTVSLDKSEGDSLVNLTAKKIEASQLELKIVEENTVFHFYYRIKGNDGWQTLAENVDATYLSTKTAGGFVGTTIGMYATSNGQPSGNSAWFDYFSYKGLDEY